jgi:hypothetical protein
MIPTRIRPRNSPVRPASIRRKAVSDDRAVADGGEDDAGAAERTKVSPPRLPMNSGRHLLSR